MANHQINFDDVVAALKETRDFSRQVGHDDFSTTLISCDADGNWEFNTSAGSLIEENGHPDEHGYRSWTLPQVLGEYSDEDIEREAEKWADGEYKEYFVFPPVEIVD